MFGTRVLGMHTTMVRVPWRPRESPVTKISRVNIPSTQRYRTMLSEFLHVLPVSSVYIDVATFSCQGHLMDAENDSADSEDPNWAYPLLRMVLTIEIAHL